MRAFNASTVVSKRSYCAAPDAKWQGGHIMNFQQNNSTLLRMLLELYFDAPLVPQSFFHACSPTSPFILQHHEFAYYGSDAAYYRVQLFEGAAAQCAERRQHTQLRRQAFDAEECLCQYATGYAEHAIDYIVSRESGQLRFIEFDAAGELRLAAYVTSLDATRLFDKERYGAVAAYVRQLPAAKPAPMLTAPEQAVVAACFARRWPASDLARVAAYFAELPPMDILQSLPLFALAQQSAPSQLLPNVHVMIPTKNPIDMTTCISSLYDRADLKFGTVQFHFGIDWKDNRTRAVLEQACDTLGVSCTYHEVYSRGGDVSAIVNHMFTTIDDEAYFLRFNDDSEMLTPDWNRRAIEALRREPVDAGIAWLTDLSNVHLQTHSFVSAVHRRVFGYYFPYHYKNIYEDDWITATYTGELRKTSFIRLKHNAKSSRYSQAEIPRDVRDSSVQRARARMARHLARHRSEFYLIEVDQ